MTRRTRKQERLLRWCLVMDTNVIISAILGAKAAQEVVNLWKAGWLQVLVTEEIVEEYLDVLWRFLPFSAVSIWEKRFRRLDQVTYIHRYLAHLQSVRDAKDNKFLDAAVAGQARYIVSRDRDLTDMKEFRQIKIVTPEQFMEIFYASRG